jgi:FG-GAP repeat.
VNDDGYDDVIVGASLNDAAGEDAGQAYVFYGGSRLDAVADATLTAEAVGDRFGFAVGTAGDVDGDGRADVIVGAYQNDAAGSGAGRAYVCYLDPPPAASRPGLGLAGSYTTGFFGCAVGTAGDVNGDGHPDLIVGESRSDGAATDAGAIYVYYGGPGADVAPDLVQIGTIPYEYFGWSVGTAGDVNGDGYDDFLVGAPNAHATGGMVAAGVAYLYFGGPVLTLLELAGAANGDQFGYSVGTAGDVNGDGYDDVIVGAPRNDVPGTDGGQAYVFFGGATPDATVDLTLSGAAAGDQYGYSVGTAGDVNGDGYDDVVVGARSTTCSARSRSARPTCTSAARARMRWRTWR